MARLPRLLITPEKLLPTPALPFVIVSVEPSRRTVPLPDRVWMEVAPPPTFPMFNVPLSTTPFEAETLPLPSSTSVAPLPIVVVPV